MHELLYSSASFSWSGLSDIEGPAEPDAFLLTGDGEDFGMNEEDFKLVCDKELRACISSSVIPGKVEPVVLIKDDE